MAAIDLVKTLMADGVEFATDSEYIRWRNSDRCVTPRGLGRAGGRRSEVIAFLQSEFPRLWAAAGAAGRCAGPSVGYRPSAL